MSLRIANIEANEKRKYRVEKRGAVPFRILGIIQKKERLRPFFSLTCDYPEIVFGLMLRDPEHRRERVLELACEALGLNVPENVILISNGYEVEGIEWMHLTGAQLNGGLSGDPPPSRSFGCSVHSLGEIHTAEELRPDYLLLSPIFPTTSKPGTHGLGIEALKECAERTTIPIIALGGIASVDRARESLDAGAYGIAGITLFDPEQEVELRQVLGMLSTST